MFVLNLLLVRQHVSQCPPDSSRQLFVGDVAAPRFNQPFPSPSSAFSWSVLFSRLGTSGTAQTTRLLRLHHQQRDSSGRPRHCGGDGDGGGGC